MEKLPLENGISGLIIVLTLSVLIRVAQFLWSLREKRDSLSEASIQKLTEAVQENTAATKHLDVRLRDLERSVQELPKFKTDIRRFYSALKEISGEQWPRIRDEIMKDDFPI